MNKTCIVWDYITYIHNGQQYFTLIVVVIIRQTKIEENINYIHLIIITSKIHFIVKVFF